MYLVWPARIFDILNYKTMVTSKVFGAATARPLYINFDAYTDGDDEFKKELVLLIIDNLLEMQQVLQVVSQTADGPLFHKVCHKIKATLEMLDDKEMLNVVGELKVTITDANRIALLDKLCSDIIDSLRRE
jgi:hypothetical protein